MYEVIGALKSRSFRVLWMLEELGQPYRFTEAPPRSDAILAVNPLGKVPAMRDGDAVLTDSVAIMTYLADKHGALTATAGTLARARQDALTNYIIDEMDAVLWTAAKHTFVLPEDQRHAGLKPTLAWEFSRAVDHLGQRLQDGPFLTGGAFTLTDIIATQCSTWAMVANLLPDSPVFTDYVQRMMDRPAYQRAMAVGA